MFLLGLLTPNKFQKIPNFCSIKTESGLFSIRKCGFLVSFFFYLYFFKRKADKKNLTLMRSASYTVTHIVSFYLQFDTIVTFSLAKKKAIHIHAYIFQCKCIGRVINATHFYFWWKQSCAPDAINLRSAQFTELFMVWTCWCHSVASVTLS